MEFKTDEHTKIVLVNSETELFSSIKSLFDNSCNYVCFTKIKRKRDLKKCVFEFVKIVHGFEREYNVNSTVIFPNDELRKFAKDAYKSILPAKMKIGVALGGGGARGSMQLGQLKALQEYGILDIYDAMCGTSIGSVNMISYVNYGLEDTIKIWENKLQKKIFKRNSFKKSISNVGLFDRTDTKNYMLELVKDEDFDIDYPDYFINSYSLKSKKLKYFHINHRSKDRIVEASLASSAIPFIYGISKYENDVYIDGGIFDNQSIKCLIDEGCNIIFVASLSVYPRCVKYCKDGVCIIDLGSVNFHKDLVTGTFSFDKRIKEKMEHGYLVASTLFNKLEVLGVLNIIKNKKVEDFYKLEKYYNLSKRENKFKISKSLL